MSTLPRGLTKKGEPCLKTSGGNGVFISSTVWVFSPTRTGEMVIVYAASVVIFFSGMLNDWVGFGHSFALGHCVTGGSVDTIFCLPK
jgi:hypothetical protein